MNASTAVEWWNGSVQLSDHERELYEAKLEGWLEGWHAHDDELDRLNWEADLWFWCYSNKKAPGEWYRHATDALWMEASL